MKHTEHTQKPTRRQDAAFEPHCAFHRPLLHLLAALVLSTPALALPFAVRTYNLDNGSAQNNTMAVQLGGTKELELFTGGDFVSKGFQTVPSNTRLPDFILTPYSASDPIGFFDGSGDAGDIDGDGDIDIVRSAQLRYNAKWENRWRMMSCLNSGNGSFSAGWQWADDNASGRSSIQIRLADLDRDGDLDLIEGSAGIRVRWNPGNGNFSGTPTVLLAANSDCRGIVTADFDNDGWPDVAVIDNQYNGTITLLTNNAGTWQASAAGTAGALSNWSQITAVDLDGDGRMDLAGLSDGGGSGAANYSAVRWFRNNGAGFNPGITLATTPAGKARGGFAFGDIDEDGRKDLFLTGYDPVTISNSNHFVDGVGEGYFCRRGSGVSFAPPLKVVDLPPRNGGVFGTDGIVIADIDQDGDNDIVAGFGRRHLENTAIHPKADSLALSWAGANPTGTVTLSVADINGDGKDDLIAGCETDKKILWYPGGANTITAPIPVNTGNRAPTSVAAADLDRDGDMDLVYATSNEIRRLLSFNGAGTTWSDGLLATLSGVRKIVCADGDSDGDTDVLAVSPAAGILRWYNNNGNATGWGLENAATGIAGVESIAAGQIFPGKRPEILSFAHSGASSTIRVHSHNGATWTSTSIFGAAVSTSNVLVANVNATPGMETICTDEQNSIVIHSTFTTVASLSGPVHSLQALDWNNDGRTDILCAWEGGVVIYLNQNDDGTSWVPLYLASRSAYQDAVPFDLNHDGLIDVAAAKADGSLTLFRNTSYEVSLTQTVLSPAASPALIAPGGFGGLISLGITNHGSNQKAVPADLVDAVATPRSISLAFYKAVASGNTWVKGNALTLAEIQQAVQSISVDGYSPIAPASMVGSSVIFPLPAADKPFLATGPGAQTNRSIILRLKPTAGSASYSRFFVEHVAGGLAASSVWESSDPSLPDLARTLRVSPDANTSMALVRIDSLTPLEAWRKQYFGSPEGTGARANDADFDHDGVANLVEYVTGTNPALAEPAANLANGIFLFAVTPGAPLQFRLRLSDAAMSNPKVRITVQQTDGLKIWGTTTARTGGGAWSGLAPVNSVPIAGGITSHIFVVTGIYPPLIPKFFLRLKVEELP